MGLETGALMNEINVLIKGIPESFFPLPCEDMMRSLKDNLHPTMLVP